MASAGRGSAFIRLYARAEVDLANAMDPQLSSHAARDALLLVQPLSVLQGDDETVELMRTMLESTPLWTNPGRLGQWSADLAWIEDDEAADAMPNAGDAEITGATHGGLLTHGNDVSRVLVDFFAAS